MRGNAYLVGAFLYLCICGGLPLSIGLNRDSSKISAVGVASKETCGTSKGWKFNNRRVQDDNPNDESIEGPQLTRRVVSK